MSETLRLVKNEDGSWRSWDNSTDRCRDYVETMEVVPVAKAKVSSKNEESLDIERRVDISLAVGRYLRSAERLNAANREFTSSSKTLRKQLGEGARFVVQIDFKHYLVTSDEHGNFNVESVTSL